MSKKTKNTVLLIILFIVIGLISGGIVGGFFAWKNKKAKERQEQPLQAEKTQEQKLKEQKTEKFQEIKSVEVKDWKIYENKEYRYKIKYPKAWFISDKETPWLVNLTNYDPKNEKNKEVSGVKVEILVQGNPTNLNLKDWVKEGHQFSGSPKNTKEMKISDLDAIWEELDFIGPTINVTIMRANDVFTVSYTGRTAEYEQYKNVFEEMVESLKL
ncbi:MAG: hypothetical protein AB1465_03200 [Patescibacteria group bacterium]